MGLLLGQKCLFKLETRGHISTLFYWAPLPSYLGCFRPLQGDTTVVLKAYSCNI